MTLAKKITCLSCAEALISHVNEDTDKAGFAILTVKNVRRITEKEFAVEFDNELISDIGTCISYCATTNHCTSGAVFELAHFLYHLIEDAPCKH